MDDQGQLRQLAPEEKPRKGEVEVSASIAERLAKLSPKGRREYHKCIKAGHSEDFALASARSVSGTRVG